MNGFSIGRVLGFKLSVDFSWFIILFLAIWLFSAGVFPQQLPGLGRVVYVTMGVVGALLFFISLVGHELAHSLVARGKGIQVEGITLFLFGGVARIRSEARTPGDEFQIAGAGPAASLVIAGLFFAVARYGARFGLPDPWLVVAGYMALLNVALAIFNLLPGFPLDGGRILRAIAWKFTGSMTKATRLATQGGHLIGYALVALGILQAIRGLMISGLWLVFIGWYLRNAAAMSYRQHMVRDILAEVTAAQTMTPAPETVSPDLTLRELMDDVFMVRRFVAFPVSEGGSTLGLVTLHQLRQVPRDRWHSQRVRDVMVPVSDACVVDPGETMMAVMDRLQASPARRVLVMRSGILEGIITAHDVTHWLEKARQIGEVTQGG